MNELIATAPPNPEDELRRRLFERPLPAGYREELREMVAQPEPEIARGGGSFLLFELGGMRLALPARVTWAIAPVLHIARIPHRSGTVLLGLIAFRGEILPCCSLARLLDMPEHQTDAGRTLILEESAGKRWAVPIDSVSTVRVVTSGPSNEASKLSDEWVQAVFSDTEGSFTVLNPDVLFRQIGLATA